MGKERLKRILLVLGVVVAILFLVQGFARGGVKNKIAEEATVLPLEAVREKIDDLGERVLGSAIEKLPGIPKGEDGEKVNKANQVNQEIEPISQPVINIQNQTQLLIESLKKLPEDQLEAIKKQIFKEICKQIGE